MELFFNRLMYDKEWYMSEFLKIRDKHSKLIPFNLNKPQLDMLEKIEECEKEGKLKRFIILKARQLGFSTFTEGLIFHHTTTRPFINSLIMAHEDKATQNIFNMSKLYYDELPDFIKPMKKYSNGKELVFENGTNNEKEKREEPGLRSKIIVSTAGTVEVGRSGTFHNVHASEVAFFPDGETTMLGVLQCVPDTMDTMVVLESTANGVGGYFYDMWQGAVKGENDYIPLFYPWFTDPLYRRSFPNEEIEADFKSEINQTFIDEKGTPIHTEEYDLMKKHNLDYEQMFWRKYTIRNKCGNDVEKFRQEYPSTPEEAFITSGRPVFNQKSCREYLDSCVDDYERGYLQEDDYGNIKFIPDRKGVLHVLERPKADEYYCIGADVAEGHSDGDYSVGVVGDYGSNIKAMWYGHIDPDLYGYELVKLGKWYNQAFLGVENNNHGLATLKAIQRFDYPDLYYSKIYDRMSENYTTKLGWTTSTKTKPLMIDYLREFIREKHLDIPFKTIVQELLTFIFTDKGTMEAQTGSHDDCVMALAIYLQLLNEGRNATMEVETDPYARIMDQELGYDDDMDAGTDFCGIEYIN